MLNPERFDLIKLGKRAVVGLASLALVGVSITDVKAVDALAIVSDPTEKPSSELSGRITFRLDYKDFPAYKYRSISFFPKDNKGGPLESTITVGIFGDNDTLQTLRIGYKGTLVSEDPMYASGDNEKFVAKIYPGAVVNDIDLKIIPPIEVQTHVNPFFARPNFLN